MTSFKKWIEVCFVESCVLVWLDLLGFWEVGTFEILQNVCVFPFQELIEENLWIRRAAKQTTNKHQSKDTCNKLSQTRTVKNAFLMKFTVVGATDICKCSHPKRILQGNEPAFFGQKRSWCTGTKPMIYLLYLKIQKKSSFYYHTTQISIQISAISTKQRIWIKSPKKSIIFPSHKQLIKFYFNNMPRAKK